MLGDDGVGKTSLISTLVWDSFTEDVPAVLEVVTIPFEMALNRPLQIIDTPAAYASDGGTVVDAIRHANVIVLVYAADQPRSFERLSTYWLPTIASSAVGPAPPPVLLVCSKSDLADADPDSGARGMPALVAKTRGLVDAHRFVTQV